ncbi:hypothetical protein FDO65_08035 [Nakamurella flava]|uniref:Alanine, arginine and proline rich protein n=1 Tax=Nakamurella flava TaxID=2576308 RepID=A0A4U6QMV8_9ACTN|nr:Rv3235 family protein [Nakamurella flava]TKV61508.1 hypothetical protein FDO65_08035 [Nakamurella flava]
MTTALAPSHPDPRVAVRRRPYLVPVPDCEPPFDDEAVGCPHHTGPAASPDDDRPEFAVRHGVWRGGVTAVAPQPLPGSSVGSGPVRHLAAVRPVVHGPAPMRRAPEPGSADHSARMLARALVEVLAGHRPAQQLRGFCAPAVFAELQRGERRRTPALPHVLSVRVCEPAPDAAEVATVYRRGDRVRMVAFRLERPAGDGVGGAAKWCITALQAG